MIQEGMCKKVGDDYFCQCGEFDYCKFFKFEGGKCEHDQKQKCFSPEAQRAADAFAKQCGQK